MSSAFAFIPRSVAKEAQKPPKDHASSKPTVNVPHGSGSGPSIIDQDSIFNGTPAKKSAKHREEELLILIEAALSDYSCWCNPELQHEMRSGQDGYIPLKHVLTQSAVFESLHPYPSEADIMRCIRASPNSILETRMLIAEPSPSEWFHRSPGASPYQSDNGGFEVRRRDWKVLLQAIAECGWNKEWWDQRIIYIERLPIAYYPINALGRYIHSLLSLQNEKLPRKPLIQSIIFPPHHLAAQDEPSHCKGFAFVVLESPALVDILCRSYPWDGFPSTSSVDKEGIKFGMRVLPKPSWEKLKVEYLTYQQRLLSQVAEEASSLQVEVETYNTSPQLDSSNNSRTSLTLTETQIKPQWYPQNCLVFVRNVHPDTNKTTLRTLLSNPLTPSNGVVDYVDFNKGVDTCHLRLGIPSNATRLVSHFTTQHTAQLDALDQVGSAPTKERPKLELEIVGGKREELYWEKVPEKVRASAVARLHDAKNRQIEGENEGGRRRKRRKKG